MNLLTVENLKKLYKSSNTLALKNVSFEVQEKEFVAIMGESGSGDSDIMMTDTINPLKSKFKASTKLLNKTI
ncbi:hypothetical protein [Criibacterium bergeronii]|uniref:hypothetical protein n=1 Tax=Criibacterium bergeronii TaxID=1871336 RepID=UPI001A9AC2D3|nr:hypothetical protein [Criibacterium bergeronii]